jgi:1,4-dihydroxy-2-naphthoate octaprenyltransferase
MFQQLDGGINLLSEYFDYRRDVDKSGTSGSSRVLAEGLLPPRKVVWAGVA